MKSVTLRLSLAQLRHVMRARGLPTATALIQTLIEEAYARLVDEPRGLQLVPKAEAGSLPQ